jgi:general secretion pathway protein A
MSSLYCEYFQLEQTPFSIAPDPRFVYMSERHREALGHLLYGLAEGGGFVQLTGEVGTGKTTICRTLLCQLPDNVDVALIFNPKLTVPELLQSICEELRIALPENLVSTKPLVDLLYAYLLEANGIGRRTVLIIDEAQNLSSEVLEQVRLLTNLETNDNKLLQVFLIGQPELRELLARNDLRQLAQRVTARYHLEPLTRAETIQYIGHRLSVAGCRRRLFTARALRRVYRYTGGVPRLVNSLCDRALLGAYAVGGEQLNAKTIRRANSELRGDMHSRKRFSMRFAATLAASFVVLVTAGVTIDSMRYSPTEITGVATPLSRVDASVENAVPELVDPVEPVVMVAPERGVQDSFVQAPARAVEGGLEAEIPPRIALGFEPAESEPAETEIAALEIREVGSPAAETQRNEQPRRSLAEILHADGDGVSIAATQQLLALWGIKQAPESGQLCRQVRDEGLACFKNAGSWEKLRGFDLPTLLRLQTDEGRTVQVLLAGLLRQDATLYLGDRQQEFRLHEVDRFWTGQFLVLWKPPLEGVTVIRPRKSGEKTQWLRTAFAQVDGTSFEEYERTPLKKLTNRIIDFQRRRGLQADGIAGPETLIHLTAMHRDPNVPSLSAAVSIARNNVRQTVAQVSQAITD